VNNQDGGNELPRFFIFQAKADRISKLERAMFEMAKREYMTELKVPLVKGDNAGGALVEFRDLSFRYGDNRPYLCRHLNLALHPGACVAIMGPPGSGKSTLAKLLQGFYVPTDGQIKLDGRDIADLTANELRAYYAVVPQETPLFSGTIYENLVSANPQATFHDIILACRSAEIHDSIDRLPERYQTSVGEHGAGLSEGEKLRLAVARALLRRPKILIFDEATSNLDLPTAERFALTVNQLKSRATILFIAHQLPTGLLVDKVIRLGDGRSPLDSTLSSIW
jgi:subfamily B ATP-binding cassette protein HlyB/CyaB